MRKSDLKIHILLALDSLGIPAYAKTKNKTVAELKTMLAELRRQQLARKQAIADAMDDFNYVGSKHHY